MGTQTQYHYKDPDNRDFESSDFLPYGTLHFPNEINPSRRPNITQVDNKIFEMKKNTTEHFKNKNENNEQPNLDSDNLGSNAMELSIIYHSQILYLLYYLFIAHVIY